MNSYDSTVCHSNIGFDMNELDYIGYKQCLELLQDIVLL